MIRLRKMDINNEKWDWKKKNMKENDATRGKEVVKVKIRKQTMIEKIRTI